MKSIMLSVAIACLFAMLGLGCVTDGARLDEAPVQNTSEVEQSVGDPLCDGWTSCYNHCRLIQCTNPTNCARLTACLTLCDSSFYPAPLVCPYPG
jgi:hypothetical protein